MFDVAIVGGGVNGCGIARDASGRGLSVVLFERDDIASGTSSASTKLIHGGLRYLEHYEFRLVRESLGEREQLWQMAPHIIWPMRFVLPHHSSLRPAWLIRIGLFLYDHIGGRKRLAPSRSVDLQTEVTGGPLKPNFRKGFEYSDCWVDDARLVVLNALSASEMGADIRVGHEVTSIESADGAWTVRTRDVCDGSESTVRARSIVNAAGPWVTQFASPEADAAAPATSVRLIKGSHLVVPRLYDHDRAYLFQNKDERVVFAIPYEDDFTLIGTTDVDVTDEPGPPVATPEEIAYLCAAVSDYLKVPCDPASVVWTFSGVRPLYDDGADSAQKITRDYVLKKRDEGGAPMVNVFGGKITTYRRLATECVNLLETQFPDLALSASSSALPGGDFSIDAYDSELAAIRDRYRFLDETYLRRLFRSYGTRTSTVLDNVDAQADLGKHFGADLYEREVRYLMQSEWARSADDIVWRRTKLGLRLAPHEITKLSDWIEAQPQA